MNPVDIYELFKDQEKHNLRVKKLKHLLHHAYATKDQRAVDTISKFLFEAVELENRLYEFFNNYIKNN